MGLNTGPAFVGNLGSPTRLNYTCIGDTVNLASRLEGLNKRYNTSIIVSDSVHDAVKDKFVLRLLDHVAVKGKTVSQKCYELIGILKKCDTSILEKVSLYQEAFNYYCCQSFQKASDQFEKYLEMVPNDVPARIHMEECKRLLKEGVPRGWSPVVVLDEK